MADAGGRFAPIETERLTLRQFTSADGGAVYRYMSDPYVVAFLPEGLLSETGAREFASRNAGEGAMALAVVERDGGELIGHMAFHPWFAPRTFEIGWALDRAHHGKGYATEAARALLSHAFGPLDCHRVIATCQPENQASWRVAEKLGMRREAHFRQCLARPDGLWWDEYFYAMLAEEFGRGDHATD